jgi:hypothetical protein
MVYSEGMKKSHGVRSHWESPREESDLCPEEYSRNPSNSSTASVIWSTISNTFTGWQGQSVHQAGVVGTRSSRQVD